MCGPHEEARPPVAPAPVASSASTTTPPVEAGAPLVEEVAPDAEAPTVRDSLSATIELAVALLRSRDYRSLIEQLVDPEDLAKIKERGQDVDSLVVEFGDSSKPQRLLEMLLSVQGKEPEMSEDGDVATLQSDRTEGAPDHGRLRFRRVGGRWYLRN